MYNMLFATDLGSNASGISALGISFGAFIIQLITFVFIFLLLKRFAFKPILKVLEDRRHTIDDGVTMGQKLEKERARLDEEVAKVMREARHEADRIIANGHKESREILRDAEKASQRKTEAMIADAELRIQEDAAQARRGLEKEIVSLISDATEAIVGEKVDPKKDAALIDKVLKDRLK
ncbi:MAG: F0F1 ATP synthase subunit B [Candidatus Saccharimonadales bacterium]